MKYNRISILTLFILNCIFTISCSKESDTNREKETNIEQKVSDSAAIAAEKKKAVEAEKAKLEKPYNPTEDAESKIAELVNKAQKENKNIILQAGGNWCIWCLRFNDFVQSTPEIKENVEKNYLYYHLNYSPENKNEKVFAKYGNPGEKFGYPVLLVLDNTGKLIHTQETGQLEEGKGYSKEKVNDFFSKWMP